MIDERFTETGASERTEGTFKAAWRSGSPDLVKEEARRVVEKSVKALAGALKGFTSAVREEAIPERARSAIHEAGETARHAADEATSQIGDLGEKAKRVVRETKRTVKGIREEAQGREKMMKKPDDTYEGTDLSP